MQEETIRYQGDFSYPAADIYFSFLIIHAGIIVIKIHIADTILLMKI